MTIRPLLDKGFYVRSVILASVLTASAHAGVYKWVDEDGNIHYGDRPPPKREASHSVLNDRGLEVDKIDRIKTEEELAADAAAAEALRLEHLEEQKRRHRDTVLLKTFTTERDLLLTRDDRLSAIDGAILLSERRINSWNEKLDLLETRISSYESEEKAPKRLVEERDSVIRNISRSENYMLDKIDERKRMEEQFDSDLARYRELKSES